MTETDKRIIEILDVDFNDEEKYNQFLKIVSTIDSISLLDDSSEMLNVYTQYHYPNTKPINLMFHDFDNEIEVSLNDSKLTVIFELLNVLDNVENKEDAYLIQSIVSGVYCVSVDTLMFVKKIYDFNTLQKLCRIWLDSSKYSNIQIVNNQISFQMRQKSNELIVCRISLEQLEYHVNLKDRLLESIGSSEDLANEIFEKIKIDGLHLFDISDLVISHELCAIIEKISQM